MSKVGYLDRRTLKRFSRWGNEIHIDADGCFTILYFGKGNHLKMVAESSLANFRPSPGTYSLPMINKLGLFHLIPTDERKPKVNNRKLLDSNPVSEFELTQTDIEFIKQCKNAHFYLFSDVQNELSPPKDIHGRDYGSKRISIEDTEEINRHYEYFDVEQEGIIAIKASRGFEYSFNISSIAFNHIPKDDYDVTLLANNVLILTSQNHGFTIYGPVAYMGEEYIQKLSSV